MKISTQTASPLLFLLLSAILNFSSSAFALQAPVQPGYYGQDFYKNVLHKAHDESLKETLKMILKAGHVRVSESGLDQIVPSCETRSTCRMQTSLGYNGARKFLLGGYYLVPNGKTEYGIREVYCDRTYAGADFNSGPQPGPGIVPSSTIINIEHTWPQSRFTGRYSKELQKADLHHLYPSDSKMNSLRGNMWFGEVTHDLQKENCHASKHGTDATGKVVFEPPANHKGHVARALFYFSVRYDMPIDPQQEAILKKWHQEHPVDADEAERNMTIEKAQGNRNPFIDFPELVSDISDF